MAIFLIFNYMKLAIDNHEPKEILNASSKNK